jgi:hypothetical protein
VETNSKIKENKSIIDNGNEIIFSIKNNTYFFHSKKQKNPVQYIFSINLKRKK